MTEQLQCAHEGCVCAVPKERAARGDEYCSDYCKEMGQQTARPSRPCGCGHPECGVT